MEKVTKNIKPFSGEKYAIWKFRMRGLLAQNNVLKVIDNETPSEPNAEWISKENLAKGLIIEYLSDSFLKYAKETDTAKEVFIILDSVYERKSVASQLAIRKKLFNFKLKSECTLAEHFITFDNLITDLMSAGASIDEMDKIAHLLSTLPAEYDGIVTAIETLCENNLTMELVQTRLLDQELKINDAAKDTSAKCLQTVVVSNKPNKQQKYKKVFKPYKKYNSNKLKKLTCYHCGKQGHIKKDCYKLKNELNKNNENNKLVNFAEKENNKYSFMAFRNNQLCIDDKIKFIVDSGASDHMVNRKELLHNLKKLSVPVKVFVAKNDVYNEINEMGDVLVMSNGNEILLKNVLLCEDIPYNLISVIRMRAAGLDVEFNNKGVLIKKGSSVVMHGEFIGNMPVLSCVKLNVQSALVCDIENDKYDLWHQRLGHIGKQKFSEIKNKNLFEDIEVIKSIAPSSKLCEACVNGKQSQLKYNQRKDKSHVSRPLYIVHTDVCGPITPCSINNENYYVIFIDQFTHYCVTYLIKRKSDVFEMFKDYVEKSTSHFNTKLVHLYCDNGREYLSQAMKDYCIMKGITYHLTIPYTPQLNGVAERMIRTITERARAMLHGSSLEKVFWGEAVLTATFLINRCPSNANKNDRTPYEMWHGRKPLLKYLKVFGATVYRLNKLRKTKFEGKSLKGILVGYEANGYKVWCVESNMFVKARDVVVDERNFMKSGVSANNNDDVVGISNMENDIRDPSTVSESCKAKAGIDDLHVKKPRLSNDDMIKSNIPENEIVERDNENEQRKSERIRNQTKKNYDENENCYDNYLLYVQSEVDEVPKSYSEIKNRDDSYLWIEAIEKELKSHEVNNTWLLVEKPNNRNIVDSKWHFTIKNDELGNPIRYKARLVARGFTQEYMVDYIETFAPVARLASFRFMVSFANQNNMLLHHMDVTTAFLNGELQEEIFMKPPEHFKCDQNIVCKLNKSIYGLKQAARCWYEKLDTVLRNKGFVNSNVDRCIYILDKKNLKNNIYIVLYVDDLVIMTGSTSSMLEIKNYLNSQFQMVDLGEIRFFLGICIQRNENIISMSQVAYIKKILKKYNMEDCKPINSPLPIKLDYEALNSDESIEAPCRNLIGCLMYVMLCTRPDICASVSILSRYSTKNNKELWQCLKRVLRYLKGTIELKLEYKINKDYKNLLIAYVDSDWGGSLGTDRKSTTGFVFQMYDNCTICWCSKKQTSVAASSTEAEYMALFEAVREAMWLKSLSQSILLKLEQPIKIHEDNMGCISIAKNPTNHKRTKHIDIKYHFSREQIELNTVTIEYVSTEMQLADAMTKTLATPRFLQLRTMMNLK